MVNKIKCYDKNCDTLVVIDPNNIPYPVFCPEHKTMWETAMNRLATALDDKNIQKKFIQEYEKKAIKVLKNKVKTPH